MTRTSTLLGTLVAASLFSDGAAATNGYFKHGYGVRSQGMAGVAMALPQDSLAAATNPAGTGLVGDRVDAGLTWFRPDRSSSIDGNLAGLDGNYSGNGDSAFLIPEFGFTGAVSERLHLGVAVHANGGMNTSYRDNPFTAFGATGEAGVDLSQLFITPSLAFNLSEGHSIGIAATWAYQRFEAQGLQPFDNPGFSAAPGAVSNNGKDDSQGWGMKLGWIGELHEGLRAGVAWSSEISMDRFDDYAGLFADRGSFDIPSSYGAGLAFDATPQLTLALDWQRIEYSNIASVGNSLSVLLQGQALGSADGPGFGWRDVDVVKLGASYRVNDALTLRAGASQADQPIPSSESFINILAPGVIQRHVSIGATWTSRLRGEWTLAYTRGLEETVRGDAAIPLPFGGGSTTLRMDQDILAVGWSRMF